MPLSESHSFEIARKYEIENNPKTQARSDAALSMIINEETTDGTIPTMNLTNIALVTI